MRSRRGFRRSCAPLAPVCSRRCLLRSPASPVPSSLAQAAPVLLTYNEDGHLLSRERGTLWVFLVCFSSRWHASLPLHYLNGVDRHPFATLRLGCLPPGAITPGCAPCFDMKVLDKHCEIHTGNSGVREQEGAARASILLRQIITLKYDNVKCGR